MHRTASNAAIVVALSLACATLAQPAAAPRKLTDNEQKIVQELLRLSAEQRPEHVERLKQLVDITRYETLPPSIDTKTERGRVMAAYLEAERQKRLAETMAELKVIEDPAIPYVPRLPGLESEWKIGMIGASWDATWSVDQVIDPDNAIVSPPKSRRYWLRASTKGVVDHAKLDMRERVLHVVDTRTYKTVGGGSKTTFVLAFVEPHVVEAFRDAARAAAMKNKEP